MVSHMPSTPPLRGRAPGSRPARWSRTAHRVSAVPRRGGGLSSKKPYRPTAEAYQRACDLEPVTAKREPAGRDVPEDELAALLGTCDDFPLGIRDAAVIALVYTSGLRRSEAAGLTVSDYLASRRVIRVLDKGNKERTIPVVASALP